MYRFAMESLYKEIDFLIDTGETVVPVEVKAEENLRAKSLRIYQDKFKPEISIRE